MGTAPLTDHARASAAALHRSMQTDPNQIRVAAWWPAVAVTASCWPLAGSARGGVGLTSRGSVGSMPYFSQNMTIWAGVRPSRGSSSPVVDKPRTSRADPSVSRHTDAHGTPLLLLLPTQCWWPHRRGTPAALRCGLCHCRVPEEMQASWPTICVGTHTNTRVHAPSRKFCCISTARTWSFRRARRSANLRSVSCSSRQTRRQAVNVGERCADRHQHTPLAVSARD